MIQMNFNNEVVPSPSTEPVSDGDTRLCLIWVFTPHDAFIVACPMAWEFDMEFAWASDMDIKGLPMNPGLYACRVQVSLSGFEIGDIECEYEVLEATPVTLSVMQCQEQQSFLWTCPRCGAELPSESPHCPCEVEEAK